MAPTSMKYRDFIDELQFAIRDPNAVAIPEENDQLFLLINSSLKKHNRDAEWGFSRAAQNITTTASTDAYDLTSGFQQTGGDFCVLRTDDPNDDNKPLISISEADFRALRWGAYSQAAEPVHYTIRQKTGAAQTFQIVFLPTPDKSTYVYEVSYKIEPDSITVSTDLTTAVFPVQPPHHWVFVHDIAVNLFASRKSWDAVNYHQGKYREALKEFMEAFRQPGMNPDYHEAVLLGKPVVLHPEDRGFDSGDVFGNRRRLGLIG